MAGGVRVASPAAVVPGHALTRHHHAVAQIVPGPLHAIRRRVLEGNGGLIPFVGTVTGVVYQRAPVLDLVDLVLRGEELLVLL